MSNLAARLATAAVLVPGLLYAVLGDDTLWGVLALTVVGGGIALDEYLRMALGAGRHIAVRFVTGLVGSSAIVAVTLGDHPLRVSAVLSVGVVGIAITVLFQRAQLSGAARHLAAAVSGLAYVTLLVSAVPLFKRDLESPGAGWLLVALGIAFLSDTVAYAFGRMFGRHPLYPQVSPNKTVEGSVGGLVGGCLATFGLGMAWLVPGLHWSHALVLGVLGSAVGQCGDLVESAIKRTYGVKDSGSVLPGHGGMLDRIDALLFVAPIVYFYVTFVL
ncbi:MAG: phosphatidate cytidylyltransferase [Myxococcales bacterium FL481]|nr:MAG: phosphatidate cytidylyltransferase [Myxococcales bacterium FL481]